MQLQLATRKFHNQQTNLTKLLQGRAGVAGDEGSILLTPFAL